MSLIQTLTKKINGVETEIAPRTFASAVTDSNGKTLQSYVNDYELIEEYKITETVSSFIRTQEPNSTLYDFRDILITTKTDAKAEAYSFPAIDYYIFSNNAVWSGAKYTGGISYGSKNIPANKEAYMYISFRNTNGIFEPPIQYVGEDGGTFYFGRTVVGTGVWSGGTKIGCILIYNLPINTTVRIYAIRN